jgi:uracil-DNA glycosylase
MLSQEERDLFVRAIHRRAEEAHRQLAGSASIGKYIDMSLALPMPFVGSGESRLVIVGQDPTIQNAAKRTKIKTVLNLDKPNSLRKFIERLCSDLGLHLDEHVYATNAAKGFFTQPPTVIKKSDRLDVLAESRSVWGPILREELKRFPGVAVISLGEPVLAMLSATEVPKMKSFWGYDKDWKSGKFTQPTKFTAAQNIVGRDIFPCVHQPSMRKAFYQQRWDEYIRYIRREAGF